jgi:hypothetical protein
LEGGRKSTSFRVIKCVNRISTVTSLKVRTLPPVTAEEGLAIFEDLALFALRYGMMGMKPMGEAEAKRRLKAELKKLHAISKEYVAAIHRFEEWPSGALPRKKAPAKSGARSRP